MFDRAGNSTKALSINTECHDTAVAMHAMYIPSQSYSLMQEKKVGELLGGC